MAYNTDIKIKLAQQADKVVNALVIQTNGTTKATYNGSAAATVNITAAAVGAAASSHTHAGTAITGLTANRALISNGSGQVAVSAVTSTELGYLDGVTSNIQTQLNGKAASSHTHGLVHSDLTTTLPDTTTDNGWSMINSTYNGFILKSIRSQTSAPAWYASAYSSGIAFGGADTKAVISVNYSTPLIKFAGGNGTKPAWNMGISGTSGQTYNLNNYLPLSGGTLTGRLTANGKISVPTTGGTWISGMTGTNASIQVTTQQSNGNYHPIIYVKTNSNHVFNLGGIQNRVGFYGYYNGRTANGTDWFTEWNVDSGTLSHSGALFINNKVRIWGDNEGGNIRVYTPSGSTYYEMDALQNTFRLYYSDPYKVVFQTDTSGNITFGGNMLNCNSVRSTTVTTSSLDVTGSGGAQIGQGNKSILITEGGCAFGTYTSSGPVGPNVYFYGPVHDHYGWSHTTTNLRQCCYITDGSSSAVLNGNVRFCRYVSSSRRYKNTISQTFDDTCNPEKLYDLPVVTYRYNDGYTDDEPHGEKLHIGFIAEDIDELFPVACGYEDGLPENWNHMELIPGMMKLIQDQHKTQLKQEETIKNLMDRIEQLESIIFQK